MKKWIILAISFFIIGVGCIITVGRLGDSLFWGDRDLLLLTAGMFLGGASYPIMMTLPKHQEPEDEDEKEKQS